MQPGRMDRRVKILRRALTRNEHGEQVETFTETAEVWAERRDVTGREFFAGATTTAENSARFMLRWRSDLLATDRLSCDDKEYDIVQIAELGRRDGLEVIAVARIE